MKRSIMPTLACAATLLAGPALAAPAFASGSDDVGWGPVRSLPFQGSQAQADGRAWDDEDNGSFNFEARIYDHSSPPWLCGHLQIKMTNPDEWDKPSYRTVKKCGPNGYGRFGMRAWDEDEPRTIAIRVCYWNQRTGRATRCGGWRLVYSVRPADE
ncbi:hypothetical protein ACTWPT_46510 [Nonomuraea sp. 3N208]|uniref:hypothetical protein n=1 Tax=Nonomuraea sp. 3N208 TaxID=3457421 RepID=UPI003FD0B648